MITFEGKVALVTGGGGTLGGGFARALQRRGMRVVLADVDEGKVEAAAARIGGETGAIVLDVTSESSWQAAADWIEARYGGPDLLVSNAAMPPSKLPAIDMPPSRWRHAIDVALTGVFLGAHIFGKRMAAVGHGHILNVASSGGLIALKGLSEYCAAKAGVVAFSEALRMELAEHNVGVSVFCPSMIGHEMGHSHVAGEPAAAPGRMDPTEGAERAIAALEAGEFYLLSHDDLRPMVVERFSAIADALGRVPANMAAR